jgi:hypothetical protein
MRMVGAVLADRAEHSLGEDVVPAAADYEQVRVGRGVQQHLSRMAVEHPGGDPAAFVRRTFSLITGSRAVRASALRSAESSRPTGPCPRRRPTHRRAPERPRRHRLCRGKHGLPDGPAQRHPRRGGTIDSDDDPQSGLRHAFGHRKHVDGDFQVRGHFPGPRGRDPRAWADTSRSTSAAVSGEPWQECIGGTIPGADSIRSPSPRRTASMAAHSAASSDCGDPSTPTATGLAAMAGPPSVTPQRTAAGEPARVISLIRVACSRLASTLVIRRLTS